MKRIRNFVTATNNSGYTDIKCFIDDSNPSPEANQKWKKRREDEVKKGEKKVPRGFAILLGDMFISSVVEVLFSDEKNNDDTLASYAHRDKAILLSGDKDFFRYINAKYVVYDAYEISKNNQLVLSQVRIADSAKNKSSPIAIGVYLHYLCKIYVVFYVKCIYMHDVYMCMMCIYLYTLP